MKKTVKRFSIKNQLSIVFGALILITGIILTEVSISVAKNGMEEEIKERLIEKTKDTAKIIESRMDKIFTILEVISQDRILIDAKFSIQDKLELLSEKAKNYKEVKEFVFTTVTGKAIVDVNTLIDVADRQWFKIAISGKKYLDEPRLSRSDNKLAMTLAVPVYDNNKIIIGVLLADTDGFYLSEIIKDIAVGQGGNVHIMDSLGTIIAAIDQSLVLNQVNMQELAKTDPSLQSIGSFHKKVLSGRNAGFGFYEYKGVRKDAGYSKLNAKNWFVVAQMPQSEFLSRFNTLRQILHIVTIIIIVVSIISVYFSANRLINPLQKIVKILKNIAEGDGDLTVRLPEKGNDETTDLAIYFNETIAKIQNSVKKITNSTQELFGVGSDLAANVSQTTSSLSQINLNIASVNEEILNQSASVTETTSTTEEIMRTIQNLNKSIEMQATNVEQSSSSIEQMVANILSVTQTLGITDEAIKDLVKDTNEGKSVVKMTSEDMQKIVERSSLLLDASNIIQNIAAQTNLLAMNAAIEAAHAGDSGKGFAVVADEIRKLAEESSVQGKTITTSLKNLSNEIGAIASGSHTVEEKFGKIFEVVSDVKNMSENLTSAMQEQQRGSQEILQAIQDINIITNEVRDGSAEMLRGGEEVVNEMQKLEELSQSITNSMNEMSEGAAQISIGSKDVNRLGQRNKESIRVLTHEVSKFKV